MTNDEAQRIDVAGWHPGASTLKRFAEEKIFRITRGFRLKDVAESLVLNPITGPFVAAEISAYVMAPFRAKGLIFVHIPKNAGTSIGRSLYGPYGPRLAHYSARFYHALAPRFYDKTPSFAILRDPVDRFVSAYFFVQNKGGQLIDLYPEWARIYEDFDVDSMCLDEFIDLQRHLSAMYRRPDYVMRPQADFVLDEHGGQIVDWLYVMGRDDKALRAFMSRHGADVIPHLNRTARRDLVIKPRQRKAILDLYPQDAALIERVKARFHVTFE